MNLESNKNLKEKKNLQIFGSSKHEEKKYFHIEIFNIPWKDNLQKGDRHTSAEYFG